MPRSLDGRQREFGHKIITAHRQWSGVHRAMLFLFPLRIIPHCERIYPVKSSRRFVITRRGFTTYRGWEMRKREKIERTLIDHLWNPRPWCHDVTRREDPDGGCCIQQVTCSFLYRMKSNCKRVCAAVWKCLRYSTSLKKRSAKIEKIFQSNFC